MSLRKLRLSCALLATTALAACNSGAPDDSVNTAAAATPTRYDARAFFTTTSYGLAPGQAWSKDDTQLLAYSDSSGIFNVYALPAAGGEQQPLTSSSTDSTYAVSWFPEDDRVLYSADRGGNEIDHLYVRETSGETRELTPGDEVKAQFLGWSGDRQSFYVLTTERDPRGSSGTGSASRIATCAPVAANERCERARLAVRHSD